MIQHEFFIPSNDGKTKLHGVEWLPEGAPKAVLQISHGVAEYILRYAPLARFLTERGFAVTGCDHLGHGESVAPGAARLYFGPKGSWNTVVDDLHTLRRTQGQAFQGLPYFLLGHSMGSFLARTYLIRYPGRVDGAILMGTGQMPPALVAGGRAVTAVQARRLGEDQSSRIVSKLSFEGYNRLFAPNRTASDWISSEEDQVDRYLADPLCGGDPSVGLFRELLWGVGFITKQSNVERMGWDVPVLFVSGEMDPVGDCGKGVKRAYRSFERAGVRDLEMKLYPGARHEILNDVCKEAVYQDLAAWLEARIPAYA